MFRPSNFATRTLAALAAMLAAVSAASAQPLYLKVERGFRADTKALESASRGVAVLGQKEKFIRASRDNYHTVGGKNEKSAVVIRNVANKGGVDYYIFIASDTQAEANRLAGVVKSHLAQGSYDPKVPALVAAADAKRLPTKVTVLRASAERDAKQDLNKILIGLLNKHKLQTAPPLPGLVTGKQGDLVAALYVHDGAARDSDFIGAVVAGRDAAEAHKLRRDLQTDLDRAMAPKVTAVPPPVTKKPPVPTSLAVEVRIDMMRCRDTTDNFFNGSDDEIYFMVSGRCPDGPLNYRRPGGDYYEFRDGQLASDKGWRSEDGNRALGKPILWKGRLDKGEKAVVIVNVSEDDDSTFTRVVDGIAKLFASVGPLVANEFGGKEEIKKIGEVADKAAKVVRSNRDDHIGTFSVSLYNDNGTLKVNWMANTGATAEPGHKDATPFGKHAMFFNCRGDGGHYHVVANVSSVKVK